MDSIIFPSLPNTIPNDFVIRLTIDEQFRYGANVEVDAKLPLNQTVLAGVEYFREEIRGGRITFLGPNTGSEIDGGELVPDSSSNVLSLYLNDEINLFERIAVSGGIRYNYSDTYNAAVLLAGNVVGHILDFDAIQSYVKFNYTQGFRPPSFEQRFSTSPVALGNQSIDPETSEAFQVELNGKVLRDVAFFNYLRFRVNYAHTILDDLIALQDIDDGAQFANVGNRKVNSVDVAAELSFKGGHQLSIGYSYNGVRDTTGNVDVRNHAPHIFNLSGTFRLNKYIAFNSWYSWVDEKRIDGYLDPVSLETISLRLDSYHLWTAGAVVNDAKDRYRAMLHVFNLLGQHYETVDGDTVAAPYPYAQPNEISVLLRLQATF